MTLISDRPAGGAPPDGSDVPGLWDDDDLDSFERRTVMVPVSSVTAFGAIVVVVGLLLAIWVISRNRSDEPASLANVAPVTAIVTTTAVGGPTTAAPSPTSAPAQVPTTATPAATSAPPSSAPPTPTTVAATKPTIGAFCQATADYSLTSLVILGQRAVADPQAMYVAYEDMVRNAPADIAAAVEQLRPLSTQVRDEIVGGHITTPEALRDWLADKAHWPAEAGWLKAQKQILPVVTAQCPAP